MAKAGPTLEYETARREVRRGLEELWRFLKARLAPEALAAAVRHRLLAIAADVDRLRESDGHDRWREEVRSISIFQQVCGG